MSYRIVVRAALVFACAAGLLFGQGNEKGQAQQAAPPAAAEPVGSPVAKQPQVKSQAEAVAVQAIFQAQDPDGRIKAANEVAEKFPNSEFKPLALFFAAVSYQQKNDADRMIVYLERTIEADPQQYQALLMLAGVISSRTREFDLDREDKLKAAEGYANKALEIVKAAPRPNANVTDDQWDAAKKDFQSQAHEAFGHAATARNQQDKAIEEYKQAISLAGQPSATNMIRLAAAYDKVSKYDEAIAVLDKVLAMTDVDPSVKKIAQTEREAAVKLKATAAAAPAK